MDVQVKAGSLVRTIAEREISGIVEEIVCQLREELTSIIADFLSAGISAVGMFEFESRLAECVRELARKILQWLLSNLEPELEKMPGAIKHKEQSYRRLTEKDGAEECGYVLRKYWTTQSSLSPRSWWKDDLSA